MVYAAKFRALPVKHARTIDVQRDLIQTTWYCISFNPQSRDGSAMKDISSTDQNTYVGTDW